MTPEERDGTSKRWRRLSSRWMTPAELWRANVQRWVDAGIVTPAQGDEILSAQCGDEPGRIVSDTLSRSQELIAYGVLLIVAASAVLYVGHFWQTMGRGGHLSVALLVAVDALIVGDSVVRLAGGSARRLGGLLWLVATIAVATSVSDVMGTGEGQHALRLLVIGLSVLVSSVLLWRNRNRPLQFLSAVTGLILTLSGLAAVGRIHVSSTQLALVLWLCALGVALASLRWLRPAITALVVAEVAGCVGAFSLSFPHHFVGVVLGLVTTVAAAALGAILERSLIIVLGVLGFFMFDIRGFSIYLRSSDAALGAGVLGLLVVCVAIWYAANHKERDARANDMRALVDVDGELSVSS